MGEIQKNIKKPENDNETIIWCTDNNGQVGTKKRKHKIIGQHTRIRHNEKGNGTKLFQLAKKNKMRIISTYYEQKKRKKGLKDNRPPLPIKGRSGLANSNRKRNKKEKTKTKKGTKKQGKKERRKKKRRKERQKNKQRKMTKRKKKKTTEEQ